MGKMSKFINGCPICGGRPSVADIIGDGWAVRCRKCSVGTGYFNTEKKARNQWDSYKLLVWGNANFEQRTKIIQEKVTESRRLKMKKCRECGEEPYLRGVVTANSWYVICLGCRNGTDCFETKEQAVDVWNTQVNKTDNKRESNTMIGKYVIVRCTSAGVFAGVLQGRKKQEVTLTDCRRLWQWSGDVNISQIAVDGTKKPDECKFTVPVDEILLLDAIEIVPTTAFAENVIREW